MASKFVAKITMGPLDTKYKPQFLMVPLTEPRFFNHVKKSVSQGIFGKETECRTVRHQNKNTLVCVYKNNHGQKQVMVTNIVREDDAITMYEDTGQVWPGSRPSPNS